MRAVRRKSGFFFWNQNLGGTKSIVHEKKKSMRHTTFLKLQDLWKNLDEDLPFCTKHIESDIYSILKSSNAEEHTVLKPLIQQWLNFRTTLLASVDDDKNSHLSHLKDWIKHCES